MMIKCCAGVYSLGVSLTQKNLDIETAQNYIHLVHLVAHMHITLHVLLL